MVNTPALPRLGSLCTGYGGLDMAVQQTFGGSLAWVADNDAGAARILAHRYPDVPNLGDITAVRWAALEPVDIVTGGYPCQPFSSAGHRKGTKDARHIWPDIARALGVLRPRLAVFENVAGHLSLGFDTVLADLARIRFDADWICVRASDIGAAHQRNRLFLLAWPADPGRQGLARWRAERTAPHRGLPAADAFYIREHRSGARGAGRDEPAARRLPAAHPQGVGEREPADQAQPVTGSRDTRQMPGRRGGQPAGPGGADWAEYGPAIARWEAACGRPAPRPTDAVGRLNPPFVEWLMGLPAGHVTDVPGLSRSAQLKALGNGVLPHQAVHALRLLLAPARAEHFTSAA
ncbi:DNA cytosine methyltransferase [Streptomyces sp. NBC_01381]|uniref:DNA cytosine methyltransferase n=1 Tax=unclassified Streptomyces TaxID=2593676 RepID=UPI00225BCD01|nr:DNA cytosine methyltransferase [Streptomyces sp. NBC_01381]MCX4665119.1 DNA cytosine methyltransferase [Streptomyces sp. NBC_01381]